jgi:hypothetical protein
MIRAYSLNYFKHGSVMERSPNAFRDMKEEDIRQHFLVQLNSQYEGQATVKHLITKEKPDILIEPIIRISLLLM